MKHIIKAIVLVLLLVGCCSIKNNNDLRKINYKLSIDSYTANFYFPKGGKIIKTRNGKTGELMIQVDYSDGSVFYIEDNINLLPSHLNIKNRVASEIKVNNKMINEIVDIGGLQKDGNEWNELIKVGTLSIGYINVPKGSAHIFKTAMEINKESLKK